MSRNARKFCPLNPPLPVARQEAIARAIAESKFIVLAGPWKGKQLSWDEFKQNAVKIMAYVDAQSSASRAVIHAMGLTAFKKTCGNGHQAKFAKAKIASQIRSAGDLGL